VAHNIIHFEIPADDVERARKFYEGLFGWQIAPAPGQPEGGDQYYMIQIEEGALAGGMMKRVVPQQQPVLYVEVESLDGHVEKIKQAGGQIIVPKTPVPTMGWFAQALDTEGNAFAIWQTDPQAA
jgi:predicted enzyme related to lactoylglutathione lyase